MRLVNISFVSFRGATKDAFVNGVLNWSRNQSPSSPVITSSWIASLISIWTSHARAIGYLIPKGWKVQVWSRSVHMDPEVYPDSKKFNPSRWEVRRNDFNLLTFCRSWYNPTRSINWHANPKNIIWHANPRSIRWHAKCTVFHWTIFRVIHREPAHSLLLDLVPDSVLGMILQS